jgi:hypothetical protein
MGDQQRPARVDYFLRFPVEFGSDTITKLSLRRIKGKDLRAISECKSEGERSLELIGKLSGQPRAVVDELDATDIGEVAKIIEGFTVSGQLTGGEPQPS